MSNNYTTKYTNNIIQIEQKMSDHEEFFMQYMIDYYAENGNIKELKKIIKKSRFKEHNTALLSSCYHGHLHVIKFLHQYGTDICIDDDAVLIVAGQQGHIDIVKYLIKNGCNKDNLQFIELVAKLGHKEIINFLLKENVNIDLFIEYGNEEVKKWLNSKLLFAKLNKDIEINNKNMHKPKI